MAENTIQMGKYSIELSHLEKKMYPQARITKKDVIDYYKRIAPVLLPHIKGRPLVTYRFPDGIQGKDFYQKSIPGYFPDWINRTKVRNTNMAKKDSLVQYRKKERWLLIKLKDDEADAGRNPDSTEPASAISGRTLEEISKQDKRKMGRFIKS